MKVRVSTTWRMCCAITHGRCF